MSTGLQVAFRRLHRGVESVCSRCRAMSLRPLRAVVAAAALANPVWLNPAAAEGMDAALARAYQRNPQLNAQRAVVRQTDEGVPQALSGYRPTISATASAGKQYIHAHASIPGLLPGGSSTPISVK